MTVDDTNRIEYINTMVGEMELEEGCVIGTRLDADDVGSEFRYFTEDYPWFIEPQRKPTFNEVLVALLVRGFILPKGLIDENPAP